MRNCQRYKGKLCRSYSARTELILMWQVLEIVRNTYETLTLQVPAGLDSFERYEQSAPAETAFFARLVAFLPHCYSYFHIHSCLTPSCHSCEWEYSMWDFEGTLVKFD